MCWDLLLDVHLPETVIQRSVRLSMLMYTKPDGHLLRSELALISNMARTIKDEAERSRLMTEYDEILKAIEQLPDMFGYTDIIDAERVASESGCKTGEDFRG